MMMVLIVVKEDDEWWTRSKQTSKSKKLRKYVEIRVKMPVDGHLALFYTFIASSVTFRSAF